MNKPAKFMFDEPFDSSAQKESGVEAPEEETEEIHTLAESQLAALRQQARDEGITAGRSETLGEVEAQSARALQRIEENLAALETQWEGIRQEAARAAVIIAIAAAKKLAGALVERYPLGETEALLHDLLVEQQQEPRIVVRVPPDLLDLLKNHIEGICGRSGFAGDVVLLGDDGLGPSDCRAEWADGGAERRQKTLSRAIDDVAARFMTTAHDGNAPGTPARDTTGEN